MGSYGLMGTESQFGKRKKVLGMEGGDGCMTMLNCMLKNGSNGKFCHVYFSMIKNKGKKQQTETTSWAALLK